MKRFRSLYTNANLYAASWIFIFHNFKFAKTVLSSYPLAFHSAAPLFVIGATQFLMIFLILNLLCWGPWQKYLLPFILVLSSGTAYFMDTFSSIIDSNMILNLLKTDQMEVFDLLTPKFVFYILAIGVFPAWVLTKLNVRSISWRAMLTQSLLILISIILVIAPAGKSFATMLREHKEIRLYSNPLFPTYSAYKYFAKAMAGARKSFVFVGQDSAIAATDESRDLVIFVLGEAARAENLSLNGYARETNPLLKNEQVISLHQMYSCGTSTAVSVPCMFSVFGRDGYTHEKAMNTSNLVDILFHTGDVDVLWRDNNSDSKGVAVRVPYENFKTKDKNPNCDEECRDVGMLSGLQDFVNKSSKKDIFIVLHQMGNHGPAYYKRYPAEFEVFKPTCHTNELENCSQEEIKNAYDNAILYTDYFLTEVIHFLKANSKKFDTALIYASDHGESLGENGIYLHGLPYAITPDAQKHVASVLWFSPSYQKRLNIDKLHLNKHATVTHDNLFHTVMGLFDIKTSLYKKEMDLVN